MDERTVRKKALIVAGAMHRTELLLARGAVSEAVRPQAIARSVARAAMQRFTGGGSQETDPASRVDIGRVLPLLATGLSAARGNGGIVKLLVGTGALTGVAAAAIAYLRREKGGEPGDGQV